MSLSTTNRNHYFIFLFKEKTTEKFRWGQAQGLVAWQDPSVSVHEYQDGLSSFASRKIKPKLR